MSYKRLAKWSNINELNIAKNCIKKHKNINLNFS